MSPQSNDVKNNMTQDVRNSIGLRSSCKIIIYAMGRITFFSHIPMRKNINALGSLAVNYHLAHRCIRRGDEFLPVFPMVPMVPNSWKGKGHYVGHVTVVGVK